MISRLSRHEHCSDDYGETPAVTATVLPAGDFVISMRVSMRAASSGTCVMMPTIRSADRNPSSASITVPSVSLSSVPNPSSRNRLSSDAAAVLRNSGRRSASARASASDATNVSPPLSVLAEPPLVRLPVVDDLEFAAGDLDAEPLVQRAQLLRRLRRERRHRLFDHEPLELVGAQQFAQLTVKRARGRRRVELGAQRRRALDRLFHAGELGVEEGEPRGEAIRLRVAGIAG